MKVLKSIGNVSLVVLAVLSCIVMITFAFYHYFVKPTTIGVNNIADQLGIDLKPADELSEEERLALEERWFLEANYYSNDKGNGTPLQELRLNYFMSPKLTQADYRSSGMQYVGDYYYIPLKHDYIGDTARHPYFFYYDTVDGISYSGENGFGDGTVGTSLCRASEFIIKIDGKPYMIKLDKSTSTKFLGLTIYSHNYSYHEMFEAIFNAIESNSEGYGDYYLKLDLSQFFTIKSQNEQGQFIEDKVTDIIKNYAVIKFHYDENGVVNSNQSIFGKIALSKNLDREEVEFWEGKLVYNLTEKDLELRYSEAYGGYLASVSADIKQALAGTEAVKINLDINLNGNKKIVGLDYNALSDLKIETLTLSGNGEFIISEGAFNSATVHTLKRSAGVVLIGNPGIEFGEVIV